MASSYYAVAYRREGDKKWKALAAYPWYDDPSGAEKLCLWLQRNHPLFEYRVAVIQIGSEVQS